MPEPPVLDDLIELMRKIGKSTDKLQIQVDYNGRDWSWRLYQPNLTASEWTPRGNRKENGVDCNSKLK